jgi:hypothetical protein
MWFRRADAELLRDKAPRYRSMAIEGDDTYISERLLKLAADLEARADEIEQQPDSGGPK